MKIKILLQAGKVDKYFMKIEELFEDSNIGMPHLYLDMDGVQADFFGEWARHHNVPTYKDIPNRNQAIDLLAHSSPNQVYKFFRELPVLKGGMKIVAWCKQNKIPYTVLSAPISGPYSKYSIKAKVDWLDQHTPGASKSAIFTENKFVYATRNGHRNVLVDDYGKNIKAWRDAGGIAIQHDENTTNSTLNKLEKVYEKYLQQ